MLVGVTHADTDGGADALADKVWNLRILADERSCADLGAPLLVVSQFTLYADTRKGRRPSWSAAAPGPVSEPLVDAFVAALRRAGRQVETGGSARHGRWPGQRRPDDDASSICAVLPPAAPACPVRRRVDVHYPVRQPDRSGGAMAVLLVVSTTAPPAHARGRVCPRSRCCPTTCAACRADATALTESARADVVVIDARSDLAAPARSAGCSSQRASRCRCCWCSPRADSPRSRPDWGVADVVLDTAGPAEFDARIRLHAGHAPTDDGLHQRRRHHHRRGRLLTPRLDGQPLDLTYTEFELLKYLVQHPGRVFSREHLLADVWGYDYYGGTRTVDVHVRRLRAKLGRRARVADRHRPQRRLPVLAVAARIPDARQRPTRRVILGGSRDEPAHPSRPLNAP